MARPPYLAVLAVTACLAGCASGAAGGQPYPSLAPRPIEKLSFAEPIAPLSSGAPDPALEAAVAARRVRLGAIARGFAGDAVAAERATMAARGKPAGSDAWIAAQAALASLDGWRSQATALTGELDQLAQDRAASLALPYPALDVLREAATAEADRQGSLINRLQRQLPAA